MIVEFIAILVLFFVGGSIIAVYSRRFLGAGSREFFVGGYRVGGFLSAMTYAATTYSAFMMIGLAGLTFATGITALGFELAYLASTILLLSTVGVFTWRRARERRWISPTDMLTELYSSKVLGVVIAVLYLFALVPYTSAQLKGIGEIFASLGIGFEVGVIFAAFATALWTIVAGLWSVASTDAYQGIWMLVSSLAAILWLYLFLLPSNGINYTKFVEYLTKGQNLLTFTWSPQMFIGMTLPWLFFALTNPQVVQRLYIPRDEKAFRRMTKYFSIYGFTYTLICVMLGLGYRAYISGLGMVQQFASNRDAVAPFVLSKAHAILAAIVFTSIIAAAISTADSIVLSVASAISREFYEKVVASPKERISIAISNSVTIVMLTIAAMFAIAKVGYVVELSVASSAYLLPLAPITLVALFKKQRKRCWEPIISLVLGEAVAAYATLCYGPAKVLTAPMALSMPAPVWILIASVMPLILP